MIQQHILIQKKVPRSKKIYVFGAGVPKVTSYDSLCEFFTDAIDAYRSKRKLSRATVARRLGLAPSTLSMLLAGKRQLTISILHQMASFLGLSEDDLSYLETMALLQRARNQEAKTVLNLRLQEVKNRLSSGAVRARHLPLKDVSHVAEWYIPALIVYLLDACKVAETPLDFDEMIEKSCAFLKSCGVPEAQFRPILASIYDSSILRISADEKVLFQLDDVEHHFAGQAYFKSLLKEIQNRIENGFSSKENFFLSTTFTITKKDYGEFRKRYRLLVDEFVGRYDSTKEHEEKSVVNVSVCAFPGAHEAPP